MSSAADKPFFHVAAGILCDAGGKVLLSERICDGPYHGLWEFPGGKIRADEAPLQALQRELHEELGVDVIAAQAFMQMSHDYPDRSVDLEFFVVTHWNGDPCGLEGQRLRWVAVGDLDPDELLPADAPLIAALRAARTQQILS